MNDLDAADPGIGEEVVKDFSVALFCRSCYPVRRPESLGDVERAGNVLALNCANGVHHHEFIFCETESGAFSASIAEWRVHIEAVVDRGGIESAIGKLLAREFVDGDVAPLTAWR